MIMNVISGLHPSNKLMNCFFKIGGTSICKQALCKKMLVSLTSLNQNILYMFHLREH